VVFLLTGFFFAGLVIFFNFLLEVFFAFFCFLVVFFLAAIGAVYHRRGRHDTRWTAEGSPPHVGCGSYSTSRALAPTFYLGRRARSRIWFR
jgi:hypothetical protein